MLEGHYHMHLTSLRGCSTARDVLVDILLQAGTIDDTCHILPRRIGSFNMLNLPIWPGPPYHKTQVLYTSLTRHGVIYTTSLLNGEAYTAHGDRPVLGRHIERGQARCCFSISAAIKHAACMMRFRFTNRGLG